MEVNIQSSLQFLNLDDVDASDAEYLHNVLYNVRSPSLELPWTDAQLPAPADWPQHPPYGGQPNEVVDTGGGGEMYPMAVPVATTMQPYQHGHPPVVPPMPNVTYVGSMHPNYHHGLAQPPPVPPYQSGPPQQVYPQMPTNRQRGSSKPSPKRGGGGATGREGGGPYTHPGPGPTGYPPHHPYPPPNYHVPFQYPNTPAPHFPTTQHAAGHPLFLPGPPLPVFHHPPIYNYGPAVFSPLPGQPPEDMKPMDYIDKVDPQAQVPPASVPAPHVPVPPTGHNVYMVPPQQPPQPIEEPAVPPPAVAKDDHRHRVHHQPHPQHPQKQQQPSDPAPAPEETEHEKPPAPAQNQAAQPPPTTSPAPLPSATVVTQSEKHPPLKSHPPKDAIITTAPPSLPPAKRKVTAAEDQPQPVQQQQQPPQPQQPAQQQPQPPQQQQPPQQPQPAPVTLTPAAKPSAGRSWAGLFKSESASPSELGERRSFKPPQNAVAISTPPTGSVAKLHLTPHADSVSHKDDVDPALRSLGDKLTHYKLEHKAILLTPRGLNNPSNYCYINATLQALIACPAFYNLIKVIADVKSATRSSNPLVESKTPIIDSMVQFINEFQQSPPSWFKRNEKVKARKDTNDGGSLDITTGPPFEPTFVYKMLRKIRSEDSFHEEGRQEDAEEFLSLLLNGLNDEMLELQKLVSDANPTPIVNGEVTANGDDWKEVTTKGSYTTRRAVVERTPLSDIFRGQLRSRVHRSTPEASTDSVQPFFTLQLDIESSEKVSEALEKLVEGTTIDGDADSGLMRQQQTLDELPCVLILHLKCFHYRQQAVSKVMKALQFPVDLKLDPKLLSTKNKANPKAKQYKLFAVVYHDGQEATKGHYLADVYHLGHSGWIRYDDAAVKLVKEEQVLDPKPPRIPYLLYYRRADTIGAQRPT